MTRPKRVETAFFHLAGAQQKQTQRAEALRLMQENSFAGLAAKLAGSRQRGKLTPDELVERRQGVLEARLDRRDGRRLVGPAVEVFQQVRQRRRLGRVWLKRPGHEGFGGDGLGRIEDKSDIQHGFTPEKDRSLHQAASEA